jgi:hypothetical protein
MPEWTKKNLGELRDVSPHEVRMQWRFARDALHSPELGMSRFTYEPGARMPWGHRHRGVGVRLRGGPPLIAAGRGGRAGSAGRPEPHLSALVDARKSGARVGIPPSSHGSGPRTSGAICARMNSVWLGLRRSAPA